MMNLLLLLLFLLLFLFYYYYYYVISFFNLFFFFFFLLLFLFFYCYNYCEFITITIINLLPFLRSRSGIFRNCTFPLIILCKLESEWMIDSILLIIVINVINY